MLESIEKLRELRSAVEANDVDNPIWVCHKAEIIADEIEREVSEKYMPLPLDAVGVPIHMGDTVEGELPNNTTVKGTVTTFHIHDNDEPDTVYVKVDCGGGWTIKELKVKHCRHVKPDPVKELLEGYEKSIDRLNARFGDSSTGMTLGEYESELDKLRIEFADKIREAVSES